MLTKINAQQSIILSALQTEPSNLTEISIEDEVLDSVSDNNL
ncbi:7792_t:CDS:1, partial [Cetraspora pellucida]